MKTFLDGLSEIECDFYEERAAIMERDGGMCRANAEREAAKLTSTFFSKTKLFQRGNL